MHWFHWIFSTKCEGEFLQFSQCAQVTGHSLNFSWNQFITGKMISRNFCQIIISTLLYVLPILQSKKVQDSTWSSYKMIMISHKKSYNLYEQNMNSILTLSLFCKIKMVCLCLLYQKMVYTKKALKH